MSAPQHTPKRWFVEKSGAEFFYITSNAGDYAPIVAQTWSAGPYANDQADNAYLLAAAPELLDALTEVVDALRREAPGTPLNNQRFDALGAKALAAIAKARGK